MLHWEGSYSTLSSFILIGMVLPSLIAGAEDDESKTLSDKINGYHTYRAIFLHYDDCLDMVSMRLNERARRAHREPREPHHVRPNLTLRVIGYTLNNTYRMRLDK